MRSLFKFVLVMVSIHCGGCESVSGDFFNFGDNPTGRALPMAEVAMRVEPDSIALGDSVVVSWEIKHATGCLLYVLPSSDAPIHIELTGRLVFRPTINTVYSIAARGEDGLTRGPQDSVRLGPWRYKITVHAWPGGAVIRNPGDADYLDGTVVELTAIPDSGWVFAGWGVPYVYSLENTQTLVMHKDEEVYARFESPNR